MQKIDSCATLNCILIVMRNILENLNWVDLFTNKKIKMKSITDMRYI